MSLALAITALGFTILGLILAARHAEAVAWRRSLVALRLRSPASLTADQAGAWLGSLSALTHAPWWWLLPAPPVVVEITAAAEGVAHYLLVPTTMRDAVLSAVRAHLAGARIEEAPDYMASRRRCRVAAEWRLTSQRRALSTERAAMTASGLLASLQPLKAGELVCVQWILTGAGTPSPVRRQSGQQDRSARQGNDADDVQAARLKQREPLLRGVGRLGIAADSDRRAYALFGRTCVAGS